MKGFYVVAAVLFLVGIGLIIGGAYCADSARAPSIRNGTDSTSDMRFWSPILIFAGALLSISGALAFVGTIGTHARKVAKVSQTDSVI